MTIIIAILVLAVIALIATVAYLDQRAKRMHFEREFECEQIENGYLRDQVPFPFGKRLP